MISCQSEQVISTLAWLYLFLSPPYARFIYTNALALRSRTLPLFRQNKVRPFIEVVDSGGVVGNKDWVRLTPWLSPQPENTNNFSTYIYFRIGKVVEQSPTPKRKPLLGPSVPPWPPASRDVGPPKTR